MESNKEGERSLMSVRYASIRQKLHGSFNQTISQSIKTD